MSRGLGISCYVSTGNEADLHLDDFLEYLRTDDHTKVILIYVEGFQNGKRFMRIAKKLSLKKPILILKGGRTPGGSMAAKSHTAAVAGSYEIFVAMCNQAGIIRVQDLNDLVEGGSVFLGQPLPEGKKVAIVTSGGGWGVLAADICSQAGLELPPLSEKTLNELSKYLPLWWSRSNPVDLVAGSKGNILCILEALLSDPEINGLIVLGLSGGILRIVKETGKIIDNKVIAEAAVNIFYQEATQLVRLREQYQKPVIVACNMPIVGSEEVMLQLAPLTQKTGILYYTTPHRAATSYVYLAEYAQFVSAQ